MTQPNFNSYNLLNNNDGRISTLEVLMDPCVEIYKTKKNSSILGLDEKYYVGVWMYRWEFLGQRQGIRVALHLVPEFYAGV